MQRVTQSTPELDPISSEGSKHRITRDLPLTSQERIKLLEAALFDGRQCVAHHRAEAIVMVKDEQWGWLALCRLHGIQATSNGATAVWREGMEPVL